MFGRLRRTVVRLSCLLLAMHSAPLRADEERTLTTPTAWWWLYGVTEAQIIDLINNSDARLIDIEVQSTAPIRFAAVFVHDSGVHDRNWWWYYGLTAPEVTNFINANNGRLIDVERYFDGAVGADRHAVIMVENSGTASKGWWWYLDQTVPALGNFSTLNNARLVDVDRVPASGNYDAIMISNTGSDASGWWHLYNIGASDLTDFINTNSARILELEVRDTVSGVFDAILIPNSGGDAVHWWWYWGVTEAQLNAFLSQNGARLTDLETWESGGVRYFAAVMINNSNELTTRIADILQYGTDGSTGLFLKEVSGPVLASLQQGFTFEPASSIKVTHHLHAMRQVMQGLDDLAAPVTYSINYTGSCPIGGAPFQNSNLAGALRAMMWFSDNAATQFIGTRYGVANIDTTSATIALMTNTSINHTPIGCAGPAVANPNTMTLEDAGSLYERVANGSVMDDATRETFWSLMQSETTPPANQWWFTISLRNLIEDEAANLGYPSMVDVYWANTRLAWKPGGYNLNAKNFVSVAGWVSLPRCDGRERLAPREYVFGVFVHDAAAENGRVMAAAPELLREQVRDALGTCPTDAPVVVALPRGVVLRPSVPNPFNPSTLLSFTLSQPGQVRLSVLDVRGREVAVLLDEFRAEGTHRLFWDGGDADGTRLPSGAYFVRVVANGAVDGQKVVLAK